VLPTMWEILSDTAVSSKFGAKMVLAIDASDAVEAARDNTRDFSNVHVIQDHLVAPVASYLRREELEMWFREAGMEVIDISWRNLNSWRGHGRFAQASAGNANTYG
jgi:hypothetical protein